MILSISMILAIAAAMGLSVAAAPEGTAIKSAADFAAMAADGKYYLANDITLDASYEAVFSGTLDGNGKAVTIKTNAMFLEVNNATISNLTVNGELNVGETLGYSIGGSEDFYAAVAVVADGASTFKNIITNVNFTAAGAKTRWGAIAATSRADHKLLIEGCINNGNVNAVSYAGGVYGWSSVVGNSVIKDCINNGDINLSNGYSAGICCRLAGKGEGGALLIENCINNGNITVNHDQAAGIMSYANTPVVTVKNCINNGEIKNTKSHAAGIVGSIGDPGAELTWTFSGNINNGTITSTANKYAGGIVANIANPKIGGRYYVTGNLNTGAINSAGGHTGGIVGYAYGRGTDEAGAFVTVNGNINTGVITNTGHTSQILAYTNQPLTTITNNLGIGKVVGTDENKTAFIGFSSADFAQYTIKDNYLIENDGLIKFSYTATAGSEAFIIAYADRPEGSVTNITEAQIADCVAKVNTALGSTEFEIKDGKIALICDHNYLEINGKCSACGYCEPALPDKPVSGDNAWVYVAVAVVAVLGTAVVSKKREN